MHHFIFLVFISTFFYFISLPSINGKKKGMNRLQQLHQKQRAATNPKLDRLAHMHELRSAALNNNNNINQQHSTQRRKRKRKQPITTEDELSPTDINALLDDFNVDVIEEILNSQLDSSLLGKFYADANLVMMPSMNIFVYYHCKNLP
jgi:hypothetical protein